MNCSTDNVACAKESAGQLNRICLRYLPPVPGGWLKWLEREFTDRKVRGSNPTSASRHPLSRLGQPGNIPALMLPSGGMAARHRKGVTAEQFFSFFCDVVWQLTPRPFRISWYPVRSFALPERQMACSSVSLLCIYSTGFPRCGQNEDCTVYVM
ncbi:hypothetical protein CSKR_110252 [Clonorchis sinensis]|uniref:Uncharacterized protein n=1 Tax=Clonorchis sinensis TaxID=79923 RepID=A0A419PTF6_CLOSI|nr:hypothetical protein CSKR_110252 [Clonorchis sinensis]